MNDYTIGKLAAAAGIGVETIRYYERRGLIEQPVRHGTGYRRYPLATLGRIRFIKQNQRLGFGLKEIKSVLELMDGSEMNCTRAVAMIDVKIGEIERKMADLKQMKHLLSRLRKTVGTCGETSQMDFLTNFLAEA